MRIAMDCANGATYQVGPLVLRELGARVDAIGVDPNGLNINDGVGSTHPETLVAHVRATGADLGIAFDGDGDRVLFVDGDGAVCDGDDLLYVLATDWQRQRPPARPGGRHADDQLRPGAARSSERGIAFHARQGRRPLRAPGAGANTTACSAAKPPATCCAWTAPAPATASSARCRCWKCCVAAALSLREALAGMQQVPQKTVNVRSADGAQAGRAAEPCRPRWPTRRRRSQGRGRAFLRPSGTEPVVRVTVEADDAALMQATLDTLADAVRAAAQ